MRVRIQILANVVIAGLCLLGCELKKTGVAKSMNPNFKAPSFEDFGQQVPILKAALNDKTQYQRATAFGVDGTYDFTVLKSLDIRLWWAVRQGGYAVIARRESSVAMESLQTVARSVSDSLGTYLQNCLKGAASNSGQFSGTFGNIRVVVTPDEVMLTTMTTEEYAKGLERHNRQMGSRPSF